MKSVFVFVLGFVFVFVILKGKFIDLKLVFLISVFVLRFGDRQDGTGPVEPAGPCEAGLGLEKKPIY